MKVGDLVTWEGPQNDVFGDPDTEDYGVVLQISKTGHHTLSARVLFTDGLAAWHDTHHLKIIKDSPENSIILKNL